MFLAFSLVGGRRRGAHNLRVHDGSSIEEGEQYRESRRKTKADPERELLETSAGAERGTKGACFSTRSCREELNQESGLVFSGS
jgi:hypothetical protein